MTEPSRPVPSRAPAALTELLDVDGLHATVQLQQSAEVTASGRDAVLVGLLERGQDGDALAGRVMLQTMLPAAGRLASAITSRPDELGDQDKAFASCWPRCGVDPPVTDDHDLLPEGPPDPATLTRPRR